MADAPTIWVLADDRAGNVSQAVGVAEALGLPFTVKTIHYGALGRLPNVLLGATLMGVEEDSRPDLAPPWPEAVIAAGRRTAPVARWIKRRSGGRAVLAQIMFPGAVGSDEFDLIAVPTHDRLGTPPANVLRITGAPHRVTPERLRQEALRWESRVAALPRPFIALIVGGATRRRPFGPELARDLGERTAALAAGGSVLIATSRRTGRDAEEALLEAVPGPRSVYRWGDEGENPYFAYLGLADAVVVTGDSMSMCSESCATTGPVHIFSPPGWASPKHERLHTELYTLGLARPLGNAPLDFWTHPPLNTAGLIADALRGRLPRKGGDPFLEPLYQPL